MWRCGALCLVLAAAAARAQSPELIEAVRVHQPGVAARAAAELAACKQTKGCKDAARLSLLTGYLELADGDAAAAASRLQDSKPPKGLEAYHGWYLGEAQAWSGARVQAVKTLQLARKTAPPPLQAKIDTRLGELFLDLGQAAKAKPLLEAAASVSPTPELIYARALARRALKEKELARSDLKVLYLRFPAHPHAAAAKALLEADGPLKLSFDEQLQRAQALLNAGDAARCLSSLEGVTAPASVSPGVSEAQARLELLLGQALLARGRERDKEAQQHLEVATQGPAAWAAEALMTIARRQMRIGEHANARKTFREVDTRFQKNGNAEDAGYLAAWLSMTDGRLEEAIADFAEYEVRHPTSKKRDEARWFRSYSLIRAKRYSEARELLLTFATDFPRSSLVPQAKYWAARAAQLRGDPIVEDAAPGGSGTKPARDAGASAKPAKSSANATAFAAAGASTAKSGARERAGAMTDDSAKTLTAGTRERTVTASASAAKTPGETRERESTTTDSATAKTPAAGTREPASATAKTPAAGTRELTDGATAKTPAGPRERDAAVTGAPTAKTATAGTREPASSSTDSATAKTPATGNGGVPAAKSVPVNALERSDGGAALARADVVREYRELVTAFAGTFYARLAIERLRELGVEPPNPFAQPPKSLPARTPAELALALELTRAGLLKDAAEEIQRVSSAVASAEDALTWGHALQALGDFGTTHSLAARHLWGAVYTQRAPEALGLMYPRAFREAVESAALKNGVEPWFVWAIMRRESAFRPEVTSIADARGLLQLIPPTAKGICDSLGEEPIDAAELYSPTTNIRLATWYLHALFERFGHPTLVAAAYNGGPAAVAKWMQERGTQELDAWVEEIPWKETRGYVKQTGADYFIYQHLYGGEVGRLSLTLPSPKTTGVNF